MPGKLTRTRKNKKGGGDCHCGTKHGGGKYGGGAHAGGAGCGGKHGGGKHKRKTRRHVKRGGGVAAAAKKALLPFLLFSVQKHQQKRVKHRRTARKTRRSRK